MLFDQRKKSYISTFFTSRKRVEHIRFGSADFSLYFADFFLKYPHISQKNWLVYEKIRYFETASHHTANKFPVDFVGF